MWYPNGLVSLMICTNINVVYPIWLTRAIRVACVCSIQVRGTNSFFLFCPFSVAKLDYHLLLQTPMIKKLWHNFRCDSRDVVSEICDMYKFKYCESYLALLLHPWNLFVSNVCMRLTFFLRIRHGQTYRFYRRKPKRPKYICYVYVWGLYCLHLFCFVEIVDYHLLLCFIATTDD
jgi:hypothetical protein